MLNEFEFIDHIKLKYHLNKIGDDCAVLPHGPSTDLVVTTDLLVENIDFRLPWTTPEFLGHKALAVSLSDIAAMGAQPVWSMLSLGIPEQLWKTEFLDRFYAGWHALAGQFAVELVGGDISRSPDQLFFDSIAAGTAPRGKAVLRKGAAPGEGIFVTGTLGGAAGGLLLLQRSIDNTSHPDEKTSFLIKKQLRPDPQIRIANVLGTQQLAAAMIDVSDGLTSDLMHLCRASGVGARLFAEKLPVEPRLDAFFDPDERLELALNGGEDFGLLFTGDAKTISSADLPDVTCIGEITAGAGRMELTRGHSTTDLLPKGHRHF